MTDNAESCCYSNSYTATKLGAPQGSAEHAIEFVHRMLALHYAKCMVIVQKTLPRIFEYKLRW